MKTRYVMRIYLRYEEDRPWGDFILLEFEAFNDKEAEQRAKELLRAYTHDWEMWDLARQSWDGIAHGHRSRPFPETHEAETRDARPQF